MLFRGQFFQPQLVTSKMKEWRNTSDEMSVEFCSDVMVTHILLLKKVSNSAKSWSLALYIAPAVSDHFLIQKK